MNIPRPLLLFLIEAKGRLCDLKAARNLKKNYRRKVNKDKIRVGFILYSPEIFDKSLPVFQEMQRREEFEVEALVIPNYEKNMALSTEYGAELDYFEQVCGKVTKLIQNGKVMDLQAMKFDYIFYEDQYINHYPSEIQPDLVSAYAKIFFINYGYGISTAFEKGVFGRRFFGNVAIGFMSTEYNVRLLKKMYAGNVNKGIQQFVRLGYPAFETYMNFPKEYDKRHILWTPRWSLKADLGDSHFLEYKDQLPAVVEKFDDVRLSMRPHPLLFATLKENGVMSEEEINAYQTRLSNLHIDFRMGCAINEAFDDIGILITDFSSIIIQFFLTGRPVIYCPSKKVQLVEECQPMLDSFYIAESYADVEKHLNDILSGNDYKAEIRKAALESDYFKINRDASKKITDFIKTDWQKSEAVV